MPDAMPNSSQAVPPMVEAQTFEPRIVAFFCNWCTYLAADLTGT